MEINNLIEPVSISSFEESVTYQAANELAIMIKRKLSGHYWILKSFEKILDNYVGNVEVFDNEPQIPYGLQAECEEVDIDIN